MLKVPPLIGRHAHAVRQAAAQAAIAPVLAGQPQRIAVFCGLDETLNKLPVAAREAIVQLRADLPLAPAWSLNQLLSLPCLSGRMNEHVLASQAGDVVAVLHARTPYRWARVGLSALAAVAFFPAVGALFAGGWFLGYFALQLIERSLEPHRALRRLLSADAYSRAGLWIMFLNPVLFSTLAVKSAFSPSPVGLATGSLLMASSVVSTVMTTTQSRRANALSLAPQLAYFLLMPFAVLIRGGDWIDSLQFLVGVVLLTIALLTTSRQMTAALKATESARVDALQASQAKSNFLATMSHEIRTPLNGVLGMAEAMERDTLPDRQRERLGVVIQSGASLLAIINDVLDLAKIEASKLELEWAPVDIEKLADEAHATFAAIAQAKGLAFEFEVEASARGLFIGDEVRLRQILCNLISNALKFTDAGCVRVNVSRREGELWFEVSDTGPGVHADQLPILFDKFVQADASTTRRYGGTGLGLSICSQLVGLMGGRMQCLHVEPHGLAVTAIAPLARASEAAAPSGQESPVAPAALAPGLRVLAAEDHPVNQQVLRVLFEQIGVAPHVVDNGEAAVRAWRDAEWDIILMDIQMPGMDGPTAARIILEEAGRAGRRPPPIVALTANVMSHQVEDYLAAGMAQVAAKPIRFDDLVAKMSAALDTAQRVGAPMAAASPVAESISNA